MERVQVKSDAERVRVKSWPVPYYSHVIIIVYSAVFVLLAGPDHADDSSAVRARCRCWLVWRLMLYVVLIVESPHVELEERVCSSEVILWVESDCIRTPDFSLPCPCPPGAAAS